MVLYSRAASGAKGGFQAQAPRGPGNPVCIAVRATAVDAPADCRPFRFALSDGRGIGPAMVYEGHFGATSSMTAVLGRMATYSGNIVKWDEAVAKGRNESPGIENYTMESTPPVAPDENGQYPIAVPGLYNPFA